jgi:hypothetical protein
MTEFSSGFMVIMQVSPTLRLSMNRGLMEGPAGFVNGGLANGPFPLTPALSLGERETRGSTGSRSRCMRESETRLSMNRRTDMPLLRSLGKDQGTLAAIDMALLRSFSSRSRLRVPIHARRRNKAFHEFTH